MRIPKYKIGDKFLCKLSKDECEIIEINIIHLQYRLKFHGNISAWFNESTIDGYMNMLNVFEDEVKIVY